MKGRLGVIGPQMMSRPSMRKSVANHPCRRAFHHREAIARVLELAGPPPVAPDDGFGEFLRGFIPDQDSAERLGGNRLAHMDRVGIDVQVVSHGANSPANLPHPEAVELCNRVNDALAQQSSENPIRFRGFATLPFHEPAAAADELKRCVNELGFVGTLIAGSCGGLFLDDERFDPVLTAAETLDLPIYVHPGVPENPVRERITQGTGRPRSISCSPVPHLAGTPRRVSTYCG